MISQTPFPERQRLRPRFSSKAVPRGADGQEASDFSGGSHGYDPKGPAHLDAALAGLWRQHRVRLQPVGCLAGGAEGASQGRGGERDSGGVDCGGRLAEGEAMNTNHRLSARLAGHRGGERVVRILLVVLYYKLSEHRPWPAR